MYSQQDYSTYPVRFPLPRVNKITITSVLCQTTVIYNTLTLTSKSLSTARQKTLSFCIGYSVSTYLVCAKVCLYYSKLSFIIATSMAMSLFNKRYQKLERIVSCASVGIKFVTITQVGENERVG